MSRRKGRYERRKTRREENRLRRATAVGGLHDVFGYDDMYKAGKKCCNGVRWKNSTQRFEMHLFSGTARRRRLLLERKWIPGAYVHFTISERGKTRPIDAPRIQDRQVHKVYTKKVLLPLYRPEMIYNNGASLEGKGFQLFGVHSNSSSGWMLKTVLIRQAVCGRFLRHCYWVVLLSQP